MQDTEPGATLDLGPKGSVQIDVAKYQAYLDDPTLSDHQKDEFITALWHIIVCLVDLGFGVHPAQQVCSDRNDACEGSPIAGSIAEVSKTGCGTEEPHFAIAAE